MTDSGYVEGFYSLLESNNEIRFHEYPSSPELLKPIADDWHVRRLQWFTKGFYKVEKEDNKIIISDLRMGVEPQYFFRFAVGRFLDGEIITQPPEQVDPPETDMRESLNRLWDRL
jgi:inner membrane protein